MAITVDGDLPYGVTAKDVILGIISRIGVGGGVGSVIEYRGSAISGLSMEGRMTVCNMSIEAGARAGMIAPDATTFAYLEGRPHAPQGAAWEEAVAAWETLPTDPGATFDRSVDIDAADLAPYVSWGTNPAQTVPVDAAVPRPDEFADPLDREAAERALAYMDLEPGTAMTDISVDRVFFGSCTNARIEDLRAGAAVVDGRTVHPDVHAMVVPGSGLVKLQAEQEGLDRVFVRGRIRVAGRRLLDVPRDEPGHPLAGRALRLDLEPKLRGTAGAGRAHPPGVAADGGGRRHRGQIRRHPDLEVRSRPWNP